MTKFKFYRLFLFFGILALYGCPSGVNNVLLESNKVKIEDSLEGGWEIDDDIRMEIRKKDDYWAFMKLIGPKATIHSDLTFHRFNNQLYGCMSYWEKGKRHVGVYAVEVKENVLKIYDLKVNSNIDKNLLNDTPLNVSEAVFESYLRKEKIRKDKAYYYYKKYDLE